MGDQNFSGSVPGVGGVPGKRNWGADGLSRDGVEGASIVDVLDSATAAGMVLASGSLDKPL